MDEISKIIQSINALEGQRSVLGDEVVDMAIKSLQEKSKLIKENHQNATQRKLATVLFADVSGFTSLSETVDAEIITETMNSIWEVLDLVIVNYQGMIDKHLGDGVMAMWGVPISSDSAPEMAIRAALEMLKNLQKLKINSKNSQIFDQINMRIGINTGPVIFGEVGTQGEQTVIGDTVNLASRLEKEAPINGVLISHDTYRHVRGFFDVNQLPELSIRGKAEAVRVYEVLHEKPRKFHLEDHGFEDMEIDLVGRSEELNLLKDRFYSAVNTKTTHVTALDGEAGIGKTRLLFDFLSWLELEDIDVLLFESRSILNQQHLPYSTLKDIFSFRFQIQDSDLTTVAREKFVQGIKLLSDHQTAPEILEERAHFLGHLLGFDFSSSPYIQGILNDPAQLKSRAYIHFAQFFLDISQQSPVFIITDNAHWADEHSLEAISFLIKTYPNLPIYILFLGRFYLNPIIDTIFADSKGYKKEELQPLSDTQIIHLIDQYLRKVDVIPDEFIELLVQTSDGNPYYLEELIRMFLEEKVIDRYTKEDLKWVVNSYLLRNVNVPDTLTGVIEARLDRLSSDAKEVLQYASIIGRVFWDQAIIKLINEKYPIPDQFLNIQLNDLRERQIIFLHKESAFADTREFEFKNNLLRDVVYETVLKRDRRKFHQNAAEWIAFRSTDRIEEFSIEIAQHYENAEDWVQAAEYYFRSGNHAVGRTAFSEAVNLFSKAKTNLEKEVSIADQELKLLANIHLNIGFAHTALSDFLVAENYLIEACVLAEKNKWDEILSDGLRKRGENERERGNYTSALKYLNRSFEIAEGMNDRSRQARVLASLGMVRFRIGEIDLAKSAWEKSLASYQSLDDLAGIAMCHNRLGGVARAQREGENAKEHYLISIQLFTQVGDIIEKAKAQGNLGSYYVETEEYEDALENIEGALQIFRDTNNQLATGICLNNLGGLAVKMGDLDLAWSYIVESIRVCNQIGAIPIILASVSTLVDVMVRQKHNLIRANELLHFALHHPATITEVKRDSEPLILILRKELSNEEFEKGRKVGENLDLDTTVKLILENEE